MSAATTPALPRRTRVLVIGGGPVGLVVSLLLSRHCIPHLVVERRRDTQRAPAAHVIRRRPMEILDGLGVGDAVRGAAPPLPVDYVTWCTTLGGTEIGRLDLRPPDPRSGARGPAPWTNCPQNLLEPVLLEAARERPDSSIARGTACVALSQEPDTVTATLRRDDGTQHRVEARWVVAADGAGSPTRRTLGIPMQGPGPLGSFLMVHFEADLSPWIAPRPGPIRWILNPESPGTLIVHDPKRSHVFMMQPQEGEDTDEPRIQARLTAALGVPVAPKILARDRWSPHVQVAARYGAGRVLLVGDAAHRFPPTGGLGLNTGIQEAWELVARLAAAGDDAAPATLLAGYEAACRPVARANADESFENMVRLGEISRVLGAPRDLEALEQRLASLSPAERDQLAKAIEAQRSHFLSDGRSPACSGALGSQV